MSYEAYISDLDATLLDIAEPYRKYVTLEAIKQSGSDYIPIMEEINFMWFGVEDRDDYIESRWRIPKESFWKNLEKAYIWETAKNNITVYKDVNVFNLLKERGKKIAIMTESREDLTEKKLELMNINFDDVICLENKRKQGKEALSQLLKKYSLVPSQAVYIGDMDVDIEIAEAVGCQGIIMDRGIHNFNKMPAPRIKSLNELLNYT
jgi:phosphoglycolate phosphatase-like HAD superfamily hydrolase